MKSTVSYLMPVYNSESTVAKSIESALNQSYSDFEFLIVLNNCTDGTPNIVSKYSKIDSRIVVVDCKEQGIVPALNKGLQQASGDYISRLDADDIHHPSKLEKQMKFLSENSDIHIVGTRINLIDKAGKVFSSPETFERYPLDDTEIKQHLINGVNAIAHPSVVFKKEILLRTGGYSDSYPLTEDYDLWLRCLRWYKFANIQDKLVDYLVAPNPNYNPIYPKIACMAAVNLYRTLGVIG